MNKKIIIIFIILLFIFKNIQTEKFTSNNFTFNNIYLSLEDKIREDLTIPKYHNLSPDRSKYLFNYTMNYNFLKLQNQNQTLEDYLSKVCFIKDNNLEETIVEKINDFIIDFLGSDTRIGKLTLVKDYLDLYKKFMILKFKENFYKNLNKNTEITSNELIIEIIIDVLFSENASTTNIKDTIINKLLELKAIRLESIQDYDNLDILFEGIDQTYIEYINKYFNSMYDSILSLSVKKIQNLFLWRRYFRFSK